MGGGGGGGGKGEGKRALLPTSNVWKIASHTILIHFLKTIEKRFDLVSPAI